MSIAIQTVQYSIALQCKRYSQQLRIRASTLDVKCTRRVCTGRHVVLVAGSKVLVFGAGPKSKRGRTSGRPGKISLVHFDSSGISSRRGGIVSTPYQCASSYFLLLEHLCWSQLRRNVSSLRSLSAILMLRAAQVL